MKYLLMDYVNEFGWPELTTAEKQRWLGAYVAYMDAMKEAGVLKSRIGATSEASHAYTMAIGLERDDAVRTFLQERQSTLTR